MKQVCLKVGMSVYLSRHCEERPRAAIALAVGQAIGGLEFQSD